MDRKDFLALSGKLSLGALMPSLIVQTGCNGITDKFIFTVITEVAAEFISGCTYAVCMAGIKNPLICTLVSKAMGEAVGFIADKAVGTKKGTQSVGNGRKASWAVESKNKGFNTLLKVYYTLSVIEDTVDLLKTLGCPDGNCNGKPINWEYVGIFGVGKYPYLSEQYISEDDVKNLTSFERCIMRNEMYARHGYRFDINPIVRDYFANQEWYTNFPENLRRYDRDFGGYVYQHYFNKFERNNLDVIKQFESDC